MASNSLIPSDFNISISLSLEMDGKCSKIQRDWIVLTTFDNSCAKNIPTVGVWLIGSSINFNKLFCAAIVAVSIPSIIYILVPSTSDVLENKKQELLEKRNEIDEQIQMIDSINNEIVRPYGVNNDVKVRSLKKAA